MALVGRTHDPSPSVAYRRIQIRAPRIEGVDSRPFLRFVLFGLPDLLLYNSASSFTCSSDDDSDILHRRDFVLVEYMIRSSKVVFKMALSYSRRACAFQKDKK